MFADPFGRTRLTVDNATSSATMAAHAGIVAVSLEHKRKGIEVAKKSPALGHRERQIVETVYRLGEASVAEVLKELSDPPTYSTIRAMLGSLVEKGALLYRQDGKRYLYRPAVAVESARTSALKNMLSTFFAGRTSIAVAALLDASDDISDDELGDIRRLIDERRKQNRKGGAP
jgi:BlaI family penicillinase repressor